MEEDLTKKTINDIIKEMSILDEEIWLKITEYNRLVKEITARYPTVKNDEEFKPKVLCKNCKRR